MPSPGQSSAAPAAIRSQVRDAVARAWDAAVASGALPAIEDGVERPAVAIERPANPAFGDLATNLAMQLARPLRRSPLDIAEALAEALRDGTRRRADRLGRGRAARASSTCALADAAFESTVAGILAAPGAWGRIPAATSRARVNVEFVSANPTGPLHIGNARGRVRRRPPVPRARGRRPAGDARVLLQRLRAPRCASSASRCSRSGDGEPVPEDGYHGDYVAGPRGRSCPTTSRPPRPRPGCRRRGGPRARGPRERVRAGIEASPRRGSASASTSGRREGSLHERGLGRSRDRAPAGRRPRVRAGRRAVVPLDRRSATTRTA